MLVRGFGDFFKMEFLLPPKHFALSKVCSLTSPLLTSIRHPERLSKNTDLILTHLLLKNVQCLPARRKLKKSCSKRSSPVVFSLDCALESPGDLLKIISSTVYFTPTIMISACGIWAPILFQTSLQ